MSSRSRSKGRRQVRPPLDIHFAEKNAKVEYFNAYKKLTEARLNFVRATKELEECKDARRAWEKSMGIVNPSPPKLPSPPKWQAPHKMPAPLLEAIKKFNRHAK